MKVIRWEGTYRASVARMDQNGAVSFIAVHYPRGVVDNRTEQEYTDDFMWSEHGLEACDYCGVYCVRTAPRASRVDHLCPQCENEREE